MYASGVAVVLVFIVGQVAADCPNGFVTNGTSCYLFSILQASWIQAMKICTVHGGELATVESAQEEEFLESYIRSVWNGWNQTDGIWLGGTDLIVENEWMWAVSKEPFGEFVRWAPGEPNSINRNGEDCLDLLPHKNFHWNDENCGSLLNFVCERSLLEGYIPPSVLG
ncbi:perlucin-like [Mizuhopecten yessoensis]|uniref:perlucin-like n=1 Tax=Mizuhopecten yessoensis TaxID=6573 RepID=UPI000B4591B3|nr:perlucin-like [Mizuhopecten yessoensis]